MSPVIQKLIDGNKQFREKFFQTDSSLFETLVQEGQRPKILVVACCDSRVDPAIIFNCQPGELFVIRNVANLVPPCEETDSLHGVSAALEFAVCFLHVEHIIILGHTQCGGVQALLTQSNKVLDESGNSFISKWMGIARPAYEQVMAYHDALSLQEKNVLCEQYALVNSLQNLSTFPWIQERVSNGTLAVHAWYFDLPTGTIHQYSQDNNNWRSL